MNRKISFAIDEFYHLYSRGVDKRVTFENSDDYQRFIKLLFVCNHSHPVVFRDLIDTVPNGNIFEFPADQSLVDIGAYCLMPNHFHLLVKEKREGGISAFMLKLLTAYSSYFNKKHKRKGQLFDGRFKAAHLDEDNYLRYVYAYIHLNPVKLIFPSWRDEGEFDLSIARDFVEKYKYSSYQDFVGRNRKESKILNHVVFPEYFETTKEFKDFIDDWLNFRDDFSLEEESLREEKAEEKSEK